MPVCLSTPIKVGDLVVVNSPACKGVGRIYSMGATTCGVDIGGKVLTFALSEVTLAWAPAPAPAPSSVPARPIAPVPAKPLPPAARHMSLPTPHPIGARFVEVERRAGAVLVEQATTGQRRWVRDLGTWGRDPALAFYDANPVWCPEGVA